jgi:hypothetical protein
MIYIFPKGGCAWPVQKIYLPEFEIFICAWPPSSGNLNKYLPYNTQRSLLGLVGRRRSSRHGLLLGLGEMLRVGRKRAAPGEAKE